MPTRKEMEFRNFLIHFCQRDNTFTIYFLFTITIDVLGLLQSLDSDKRTLFIVISVLNTIMGIQQRIISKQKFFYYQKICLSLSKLSTIVLILIVDDSSSILVILVFEKLDFTESDSNQCKRMENLIIRFVAFFILLIQFNLIVTLAIAYSIILEINRQIFLNQQIKLIPKQTIQTQLDSQWTSRLQIIPSCYFIINPKTMEIVYKNKHTHQFFSDFFQNESELDEILLRKLQFRMVQEKIDQIKDFSSKKSQNEKSTGKLNRWQFKSDSVSLKIAPQGLREQLRQNDSLDYITTSGVSLIEFLQNNKFGDKISLISSNSIECICDQARSTLMQNQDYACTAKNIQLFGQIIQNYSENEIIVILNDISKQAELQQLMSNDEFKSKIIESFSHELRTPLNSALNFLASALQNDLIEKTIKEQLIDPAISSLKMQSYFINDIIDLSQIYANTLQMKIEEFTLRELVHEITNIFKIQFEMKELEFHVDLLDSQTTVIAADYSRLIQVLVNLLQNSLKFSQEGLIVLKISQSLNNSLKFTVSDMGQGIENDHLYQLQVLLGNIEQDKNIQINRTWQGFGLLVSAILVNKLAPKDNKIIQIFSNGINCGTEVSFYLENHILVFNNLRQNTIRQSSSRFQSSNEGSKADVNGHIYQATEFHVSKQFLAEHQYQSFTLQEKSVQQNKRSETTNDIHMQNDSQSFEAVYQKYGQLSPLQPSLITEKLMKFPLKQITSCFQSSRMESFKKISFAEIQQDEDLLKIYKKKKKCTCQNILSIDDEIFNQRSIQILLSNIGFNVVLAFNGEQAIQKITEMKLCSSKCQLFTLILMDYQMPIMDGLTTTRKLIEMMNQRIIPKIHIIGLTAFTSSQDIENCINAGMSDVLSKPLNLKCLREILMRI